MQGNDGAFAALNSNGTVFAFGNPFFGGDLNLVSEPFKSQLSSQVKMMFSNAKAFAAIKLDGSVVTWGSVKAGGETGTTLLPEMTNVRMILSNRMSFLAVTHDRRGIAWGHPNYGGNLYLAPYVSFSPLLRFTT